MTRRLSILTALLAASFLSLAAVSAASAAVRWQIDSSHAPANLAPGDADNTTPEGEYELLIQNDGDTAATSDGSPAAITTVTDTLPPGVSATSAGGLLWECPPESFFPTAPGATVTCTFLDPFLPLLGDTGVAPPQLRGTAPLLFIHVSVDQNASGTAPNKVQVTGGGTSEVATSDDPTTISATPAGFGLTPAGFVADAYDAKAPGGNPVRQVGAHPYEARFDLKFNLKLTHDPGTYSEPEDRVKDLVTKLPKGFVGNPEATPKCSDAQLSTSSSLSALYPACPTAAQVGSIDLVLNNGQSVGEVATANWPDVSQDLPVYNMTPNKGQLADFGFVFQQFPTHIIASLDPADHYQPVATIHSNTELYPVRSAKLALWGVPADHAHDALRFEPAGTFFGTPAAIPPRPFLTLPSDCSVAGQAELSINSWQHPGVFKDYSAVPATPTGCAKESFNPSFTAQPTTTQADSPSGLSVDLGVPQDEQPGGLGTPPLRKAVVTLPEGMSVNPSSADGLGGCTEAQIGLGTDNPVQCPDSSKIGSVELTTPLLPDPVKGSVYLAKQTDNPFNSLLALYIVVSDPDRGLLVKLPGRVSADPATGRLTTTFDDNPQLPFSNLHLELNSGPRAPLRTPDTCGTFTTTAALTSWNSEVPVATPSDSFQITQGCAASKAARPFNPTLQAGTQTPIAGAFSPFVLKLSRPDGSQELGGLSATLPPGMVGRLAGIPECPRGQIDAARARTALGSGALEAATPSCPAGSRVGKVTVGAGAGSTPFYVQGQAYLSGPYKGAPLSLAIITPALAGPFDLGTVVVQAALRVNPRSTQITAVSDPIPHILQGIPLDIRSVAVAMDRPDFTLNPTSCDEMAVNATASSLEGKIAALSNRFQVGACAALAFKPKLQISLKGKTTRAGHPALKAVLTYPKQGDYANIARAQVGLPHSEFLDQGNIGTVCTQAQLASKSCPKASVYGRARAWSPLLDKPLEGPVYLGVGFGHGLPDLVADLDGQIRVLLNGRVDTDRQGGIRNTFEAVPDAPVSRFVLELKGGPKYGLLENSENICKRPQRAEAGFTAQNGKVARFRPLIANDCGGEGKDGKR